MNIFKIKLDFSFKNTTLQDIIKSIRSSYADRSGDLDKYLKFVSEKWNNLNEKNLKDIFESEQILVYSNIHDHKYFLINENENIDKNKTTLSVIILSEDNDETEVLKCVLKQIKSTLKERKIKVNLPKKSSFIMYMYDEKSKDILYYHYVIRYDFETKLNLNFREKILMIIMFITTIILSLNIGNIIMPGVKESLIASAIFIMITTILTNIDFRKKVILKKLPELYDLSYGMTDEDIERFYKDYFSDNAKAPDTPILPSSISTSQVSIPEMKETSKIK